MTGNVDRKTLFIAKPPKPGLKSLELQEALNWFQLTLLELQEAPNVGVSPYTKYRGNTEDNSKQTATTTKHKSIL